MAKRRLWAAVVAALALVVSPVQAEFALLDGTIRLPERFTLPRGSVIEVELVDTRAEDGRILAMISVEPGTDPLAFQLSYDETLVLRGAGYRLRGRARLGAHVVLRSTQSVPVLGDVPAYQPELVLEAVTPADTGSGTVGRPWRAVELRENPALNVVAATLTLGEDGEASGNTGCNRFKGRYQLSGETLSFGRMAVGKRGCTTLIQRQEREFLRVLRDVRSFRHDGRSLVLLDAADLEIMRLN